MAKSSRLSRADFAAMTPVRRVHGELFSLTVSPLAAGRRTSHACVISKAVAAKATDRNQLKRYCREAARKTLGGRALPQPLALVFRAKRSAKGAVFTEIERDIQALVDKIPDTSYNTAA